MQLVNDKFSSSFILINYTVYFMSTPSSSELLIYPRTD
jgi:hypothetical protein